MGRLTTHVLDTARGLPGGGIPVVLYAVDDNGHRTLTASTVTNADGRTDAPLLVDADVKPGIWELEFRVAGYFSQTGLALPEPPFFDRVTLRFGIADPDQHYHVPLLVSPWSYSTYRGS